MPPRTDGGMDPGIVSMFKGKAMALYLTEDCTEFAENAH